jgi:hypothetical protein
MTLRGVPWRHPESQIPEGELRGRVFTPTPKCGVLPASEEATRGCRASLGTPKHSSREQAGPRDPNPGALPNRLTTARPEGSAAASAPPLSRQASPVRGRVSSASPGPEDPGDQPNVLQLSASVAASRYLLTAVSGSRSLSAFDPKGPILRSIAARSVVRCHSRRSTVGD